MRFQLDPTSASGISAVQEVARQSNGYLGKSGVQTIIAGTNVTVDNTDPAKPIVSATGGAGGTTLPTDATGWLYDNGTGTLAWTTPAKADVGLGNVDNTSDATKNAAVATLTNKDLTSVTNTFPTLNQSTTGNAATATKFTTGRTIAATGDVTYTSPAFDGSANVTAAATVTKINGTSLAGLATGILKNTTTTGVPSIAVAADFPTLNQNTTGSAATLTTARTVQTNLAVTTSATFNGSANITPGVTGTLPVGNGGTGAATLTGLVKGNGTSAMTAAVAGTDYLAFSGTAKISVGTVAPSSPVTGDLWVDTN